MAHSACPECKGPTEWDDQALSDICLLCGTLVESSQSILTHELDYNNNGNDTFQSAQGGSALHNPFRVVDRRGRQQFESSAASKDARTFKKKLDMRDKIRALTQAVSAHGAYDRATYVFEAAMDKGKYRWGRRALIMAAASVSIALRESNQSGSIRELSAIIDTQHNTTFRAFSDITSLLNLKVTASANPESLFPVIFQRVTEACQPGEETLSKPHIQFFKPLCMREVLKLATSLATLTATLISELSIAPSACALFIVAAEAQAKGPIPFVQKDLLPFLGGVVGMISGTKTIAARLKFIRDEIDKWKTFVPWLENNASFGVGRDRRLPRGKRKRVVASRGIKDLIDMEMDKWDSKIVKLTDSVFSDDEAEENPLPPPGASSSSTSTDADDDHRASSSGGKRRHPDDPARVDKRRRIPLKEQSYRFILDPSNSPLYSASPSPRVSENLQRSSDASPSAIADDQNPCLRLSNFILSAPSYALTEKTLPSRLTLLASDRNGAENVNDDELFLPGELEELFRDDHQRQEMRQFYGWEDGVGELGWEFNLDLGRTDAEAARGPPPPKRQRQKAAEKGGETAGSRRINMSAFESFFTAEGDAAGGSYGDEDLAYASLGLLEDDEANLAEGYVVGTVDDGVGDPTYDLLYPNANDGVGDPRYERLYLDGNGDDDYSPMIEHDKHDYYSPMNEDEKHDYYYEQEF